MYRTFLVVWWVLFIWSTFTLPYICSLRKLAVSIIYVSLSNASIKLFKTDMFIFNFSLCLLLYSIGRKIGYEFNGFWPQRRRFKYDTHSRKRFYISIHALHKNNDAIQHHLWIHILIRESLWFGGWWLFTSSFDRKLIKRNFQVAE